MEYIVGIVALVCIFVVFPSVLFTNITKWKQTRSLSVEDENLMDELYDLARRLSDRVDTVERIVAADNPNFRPGLARPENTYAALADDRDERPDRHDRLDREDELRTRRQRARAAASSADRQKTGPDFNRETTAMNARHTKFYLNRADRKWCGVCAGIADYTGLDVTIIRIGLVALTLSGIGFPWLLAAYWITAKMAPDRPRELAYEDRETAKFWQGVRRKPTNSIRDVRSKFRELDRRLADVELHYTSQNSVLANEIDSLR